jgi:short-subunit dehydrogenase
VTGFCQRYGPWALVAGASEGIGAAFTTALAERGLDLVLVARRPEPLTILADRLPVRTLTVAADLATTAGLAAVEEATRDLEVGLVVVNAAYSPIGRLIDQDPAQTQRALDLNCRAPLVLAHRHLPAMAARGRGGLIIMSSLAGLQGTPSLATYAATKAFGAVLAEGLWAELRGSGVDVLACVAGAVATPGLDATMSRPAPGTLLPERVAEAALRALGRRPRTVPGALMRISAVLMTRLLPRQAAIALIAGAARDLTPPTQPAIEASAEPHPGD